MSSQITTAFVQQYSNNVQMLSQQKGSLLRNSVDAETIVGKHAFFEQVGSAVAQKRVSRHSDTPQIDTPHQRRRVSMVDYEYADLIDKQDQVRTLIDPTSSYAQAAAFALGRAMDDEIISAVSGNAFSGETGSTTVALPAGQKITESGTDGLTIAKLRSAKEKFDSLVEGVEYSSEEDFAKKVETIKESYFGQKAEKSVDNTDIDDVAVGDETSNEDLSNAMAAYTNAISKTKDIKLSK